jgi:hypothetical protein
MKKEQIYVKTYSGYKANERPISFIWKSKEYIIKNLEKIWIEENFNTRERKTIFKVKTECENVFLISYHQDEDKWFIETKNEI